MRQLLDRTGEKNRNNFGSMMEIVEYINNANVLVKFIEHGDYVRTTYSCFKNGSVKSLYDKSVYGIGFFGEGKHKASEDGKLIHKYKTWHGMMRRCYDTEFKKRSSTYLDCRVDDVWHNYQNFGDWYEDNYYRIENERVDLDKDILVKGNKVYSPDTCMFVPARINTLFANCETDHGKFSTCVYTNGRKGDKKFSVRTRTEYLGSYRTIEEAARIYKWYKEDALKEVANEYKDRIPVKLYQAMINYKIDIKIKDKLIK